MYKYNLHPSKQDKITKSGKPNHMQPTLLERPLNGLHNKGQAAFKMKQLC
jgi:hypothetical protein